MKRNNSYSVWFFAAIFIAMFFISAKSVQAAEELNDKIIIAETEEITVNKKVADKTVVVVKTDDANLTEQNSEMISAIPQETESAEPAEDENNTFIMMPDKEKTSDENLAEETSAETEELQSELNVVQELPVDQSGATRNAMLSSNVEEGVNLIDDVPYVYDRNGNLVISSWYTTSTGSKTYADENGVTRLNQIWNLSDGKYVFGADGYLLMNDLLETADGQKTFARPDNGQPYANGAFTVSDGIRYVFNPDGYILKDDWLYEDGYGWAYGRPQDGAAYRQGIFAAKDNIRYAFDNYGYVAENRWIYEPEHGYAFGRPKAQWLERGGEVYSNGAFTVSDGIRYVFNPDGYILKDDWLYENGYGWTYGRPQDGAVYRQGAFTVKDNIRYAFDNYGYLAENHWIYEPGYGYAFGRPKHENDERGGAVYRGGAFTVSDGIRYAFNEYGYRADNQWVYEEGYGFTYGDPETGKAYRSCTKNIDGNQYVFSAEGYVGGTRFVLLGENIYFLKNSTLLKENYDYIPGLTIKPNPQTGLISTEHYQTIQKVMAPLKKANAILDNVGRDLRKGFDWLVKSVSYKTMTVNYLLGSSYFANIAFDNRQGNCYTYSAAFYYMAKALGYDVRQISSYHQGRTMKVNHSWCEIREGDNIYVYDPQLTSQLKRNGYHLTYGAPGTLRYLTEYNKVMSD